MPSSKEWKAWNLAFKKKVRGGSIKPKAAYEWIHATLQADSWESLADDGQFETLNYKIASGLMDICTGEFKRKLSLIERQLDEMNPPQTLNGRQMYWMLNQKLQVGATDRSMIEYDALKYVSLKGDNLVALLNDWDSALDAMTERPPDSILLNLWDAQVQKSTQFSQTYSLYEMKITHEDQTKDYEVLLSMVRKHVEEKARKKNVLSA